MSEPDSSDVYQMLGSVCTVPFLGVIFYLVKMFDLTQYFALLHLTNLVFYPGFYFWVFGKSSMTWESWKAFFPIAICQIFVHLVIFLVCYFRKPKDFLMTYYKTVVSWGFHETTVLAYNICDVVLGQQFDVICVYYNLLDNFVFYPLLKMVLWKIYKREEEENQQANQNDDDSLSDIPVKEDVEIIPETKPTKSTINNDTGIEDINQGSDEVELSEQINQEHNEQRNVGVDDAGNPDVTAEITSHDVEAAQKEEEEKSEPALDTKKVDNIYNRTLLSMNLHSWFNARNIGIVAGIIWSIWAVTFPEVFNQYFGDLRTAVCSSILSICGALCAHIGIKTISPMILLNVAYRYILYPLVIAGLAKAFGLSSLATKASIFSSCSPMSINVAKRFVEQKDMELEKAYFFWSYVAYIPFIFIWGLILNETNFV